MNGSMGGRKQGHLSDSDAEEERVPGQSAVAAPMRRNTRRVAKDPPVQQQQQQQQPSAKRTKRALADLSAPSDAAMDTAAAAAAGAGVPEGAQMQQQAEENEEEQGQQQQQQQQEEEDMDHATMAPMSKPAPGSLRKQVQQLNGVIQKKAPAIQLPGYVEVKGVQVAVVDLSQYSPMQNSGHHNKLFTKVRDVVTCLLRVV
jgi:hypothetical protein